MNMDQVFGLVRTLLVGLGGFFVAKGTISADTLNWAAGGILTIGPALWSLWSNRPAGIAGSANAIPGVTVIASATAPEAVKAAVQ